MLTLIALFGCPPAPSSTPTGDSRGSDSGPPTATDGPLTPADIVTDRDLSGLRLQIDWVTDRRPDPEVLDLVAGELERLRAAGMLRKPAGIEIVLDEELPPIGAEVNTFETLSTLLYEHAGPLRDEDFAVVQILYVDGAYEQDTDEYYTLGFAWGGSWLVMLADNVASGCERELTDVKPGDQDAACQVAEASVLMHELGHLFGLVNNGVPMATPHEDPDHRHHDVSEDCLMYWLMADSGALREVGRRFGRGELAVPRLDAACEADLASFQP